MSQEQYEAEAAISAAIAELQTMHADQEMFTNMQTLKDKLFAGELTPSQVITEAETLVSEAQTAVVAQEDIELAA